MTNQLRKRGRPRTPDKADDLLNQLEKSGCNREYVRRLAQILADWNWGTEKWKPPSKANVAAVHRAAAVIEGFGNDFFLCKSLPKADMETWEKRLGETRRVLQECACWMATSRLLMIVMKRNARRYLLIHSLVHHVMGKTGKPRFTVLARLITKYGQAEYEAGKLQNQFNRAQDFYSKYDELRKEFPRHLSLQLEVAGIKSREHGHTLLSLIAASRSAHLGPRGSKGT